MFKNNYVYMCMEISDNLENNYKKTMRSYMPYLKKNQIKNKKW